MGMLHSQIKGKLQSGGCFREKLYFANSENGGGGGRGEGEGGEEGRGWDGRGHLMTGSLTTLKRSHQLWTMLRGSGVGDRGNGVGGC